LLYHSPSQKNEKSIMSAARIRRASSSPFFIAITNHIANRPADRSTRQLDIGTPVLYVNRRGGVGEQRRSPSKARENGQFRVPLTAWRKCTRCMKCSTSCNDPCFTPVGVGWACKSCQKLPFAGLLCRTSTLCSLGGLSTMGERAAVSLLLYFSLLCCSAVSCHATDVLKRDVFDK
jgi:hypothetical protein